MDVGDAVGDLSPQYISQTATEFDTRRVKSRMFDTFENAWYPWVETPYSEMQELTLLNGWKLANSGYGAFCSKCGNVGHITAWIVNPSATQAWNGIPFLLPYKCLALCDDAIYKSTGESMLVQIGGSAFFFHSDIPANTDIHINITYICE